MIVTLLLWLGLWNVHGLPLTPPTPPVLGPITTQPVTPTIVRLHTVRRHLVGPGHNTASTQPVNPVVVR